MRVQFVEAGNRTKARKMCPWAMIIVKVEGGYRCFECRQDYATWRKQV
jgi:hypothetical protein